MKRLIRRKSDGRIVEQYAKSTHSGVVFARVYEGWEIVDLREVYDPVLVRLKATIRENSYEFMSINSYYAGELDQ